jgi:hypothetical protein
MISLSLPSRQFSAANSRHIETTPIGFDWWSKPEVVHNGSDSFVFMIYLYVRSCSWFAGDRQTYKMQTAHNTFRAET